MKVNTFLSVLTGALVLFLAGSAFVLSYHVLLSVAEHNGINASISFLWPLTLDSVMVAASLAVLRNSLANEPTRYQWSLVGVFTLASIAFNVIHAPDTLLGRAVSLLPPLALFACFELLMSQVKSQVKRRATLQTIDELMRQTEAKRAEVEQVSQQMSQLTAKRDTLQGEIVTLRKEKRGFKQTEAEPIGLVANDTHADTDTDAKRVEVARMRLAGIKFEDIAQALRISLATAKRYHAQAKSVSDSISGNGHGSVEVSAGGAA